MRQKSYVSLETIAREAGCSTATVSRVLNNTGRISPETRQRVLELYRNRNTKDTVGKQTIYLILPPVSQQLAWYSVQLLNHIRIKANEHGFVLEIISAEDLHILKERNCCGVICQNFSDPVAREFGSRCSVPLICINAEGNPVEGVFTIDSDEYQGMRLAVHHLYSYNHRRIALLLPNTDVITTGLREKAFLNIMTKLDLAQSAFVERMYGDSTLGRLAEIRKKNITAVICLTESLAVMLLHDLRRLNCRVPEDISLITGEMPHVTEYQNPPLTTLEQNFEIIAVKAIETLEFQLSGRESQLQKEVEYKLNKRSSVALIDS